MDNESGEFMEGDEQPGEGRLESQVVILVRLSREKQEVCCKSSCSIGAALVTHFK